MTIREKLRELFYTIMDKEHHKGEMYGIMNDFINTIDEDNFIIPKSQARVIKCDEIGCCSQCPILHSSGSCPVDDFTENTNRTNRVIIVEKQ